MSVFLEHTCLQSDACQFPEKRANTCWCPGHDMLMSPGPARLVSAVHSAPGHRAQLAAYIPGLFFLRQRCWQPGISRMTAAAGVAAAAAAADQQQGQDVKKALRQQVKKHLKGMGHETMQQQSSQIEQHLLQSRFFQDACSVGLYVTCERLREVDTSALLAAALQLGKQVFVPLVEDKSSNMSLLHIDTLQDLQPAPPFGILEPSRSHPDGSPRLEVLQAPYQLDLLLMPGLAFDTTGARLGRGGGYYDKLVHNLDDRAKQQHWHRPWLVALAFSEQLVPEVPMSLHDRHVDVLATPRGLLVCSDRAKTHLQHVQQQ